MFGIRAIGLARCRSLAVFQVGDVSETLLVFRRAPVGLFWCGCVVVLQLMAPRCAAVVLRGNCGGWFGQSGSWVGQKLRAGAGVVPAGGSSFPSHARRCARVGPALRTAPADEPPTKRDFQTGESTSHGNFQTGESTPCVGPQRNGLVTGWWSQHRDF